MKTTTETEKTTLSNDGHVWADPMNVVSDPTMSTAEKRVLLASWASDARAVPNHPPLRRLDNGHLVSIDVVLDALKQLDRASEPSHEQARVPVRKGHWSRVGQRWRRFIRDDDDDDPFSPAPAMRPPRLPVLGGAAAVAA